MKIISRERECNEELQGELERKKQKKYISILREMDKQTMKCRTTSKEINTLREMIPRGGMAGGLRSA